MMSGIRWYRLWLLPLLLFSALLYADDPLTFATPDGTTYKVVGKLGSGGFASVYKVEKSVPGQPKVVVALKVYKHSPPTVPSGRRDEAKVAEEKLTAGLKERSLTNVLGIGERRTAHVTYDSDGGVDLFGGGGANDEFKDIREMPITAGALDSDGFKARLKALNDPNASAADVKTAVALLHQIKEQSSAGLGQLFSLGLVHGDLKPGNFMFFNDGPQGLRVVLSDFDTVHERGATPLYNVGSPKYAPPEFLRSTTPSANSTTEARDVYSYATSLCELAFGEHPVDLYFSTAFVPPRTLNQLSLAFMMNEPTQHAEYLKFVGKRWDALIQRAGGDKEAKARLQEMKAMSLAGLTADPVQRVYNFRQSAPASLVKAMQKQSTRIKFKCWWGGMKNK